jgi:hypothetical protein
MLLCYDVIHYGGGIMTKLKKRTTIYLDPVLHKALRLKSISTNKSVSEIISDNMSKLLIRELEDIEDLAAIEERKDEIPISLEEMKKRLKADGII